MRADYAAAVIKDKYGYIDKAGNIVISPRFDSAGPIINGRAYYGENGKVGYIDGKGNVVIKAQFDSLFNSVIVGATFMTTAMRSPGTETGTGSSTGTDVMSSSTYRRDNAVSVRLSCE